VEVSQPQIEQDLSPSKQGNPAVTPRYLEYLKNIKVVYKYEGVVAR